MTDHPDPARPTVPADFCWGVTAPGEDLALPREVDACHVAVPWAGGAGRLDAEELDRHRALLTGLRETGRATVVTVAGPAGAAAWARRDTAHAFAEHAAALARALGGLVTVWVTLDEPVRTVCQASDPGGALAAAHHLSLGHGLAARAVRGVLGEEARVAAALDLHVTRPGDPERAADLEAAHEVDLVTNHLFLGPLLEGTYPVELPAATRRHTDWSFVRPGDLVDIRQRLDHLEVAYDGAVRVRRGGDGAPPADALRAVLGDVETLPVSGRPTTTARGSDPEGLTELLTALDLVHEGLPLVVTEPAPAPDDGAGGDPLAHLRAHLAALIQARDAGANVRGYVLRAPQAVAPDVVRRYADLIRAHTATAA